MIVDESPHQCKLSILLVTYNHSNYISKALDGIISQECKFRDFEIVVADDCSTDDTLDIIQRRFAEHPELKVNYLERKFNLGIVKNYQRALNSCRGEYVAIIEGDDYWIYNKKLQQQVNFLDEHSGIPACGTNYFVFSQESCAFYPRRGMFDGVSYFDAPALIRDNVIGNFSNMMYRRQALLKLPPKMYEIRAYDWLTNIMIATEGPIGFLNKPSVVYRVHSDGSWSGLSELNKLRQQINDVETYDKFTGGRFHAEFLVARRALQNALALRTPAGWRQIGFWRTIFPTFLPPFVLSIWSGMLPPIAYTLVRKIRKGKS